MNEKASCITINCGCCGNGNSGTTPTPETGGGTNVSGDEISFENLIFDSKTVAANQLIKFTDESTGNMSLKDGFLVVPPGIYYLTLDFRIDGNNIHTPATVDLIFYDATDDEIFGLYSTRTSMNNNSYWSIAQSNTVRKFEKETKLGIKVLALSPETNIPLAHGYATVIEVGRK